MAGARDSSLLERALPDGATWSADGITLRHTGPAPARVGEVTCLLDGHIYAGPETEQELAEAWAEEEWGLLARLRGDHVILFWDHAAASGVFVSDPLGGRSLCWRGPVFGSEVRDVLALLERRPGPDDESVVRWLSGRGPARGRTFYTDVQRLTGGRALTVGGADRAWWEPGFTGTRTVPAGELRAALGTAVARRIDDDTGALLSGGLDSAAVVALAARPGLRTYSAVFPDEPSVDESEPIAAIAEMAGARSTVHEARAGGALRGALPYLRAWELPPSSPNLFFWLPMLEAAARDGIAALLDGEGGDELFGAPRYLIADMFRRGRPDRALRLARRFPGAGDRPPLRPLIRVLTDFGLRGAWRALEYRPEPPAWLRGPLPPSDDDWRAADGPLWWAGLVDTLRSADGPALARDHVRRRSALAGVEPRHPLQDLDLVELMLASDPAAAFDPHLSRPLLRDAMRGLIPEPVRLRPQKSTFDAVFQRSMFGAERDVLERLLADPDAEVRAFVDLDAARGELLAPGGAAPGARARALTLWRLATAELWLRAQQDAGAPARLLGAGRR